MMNCFPSCEVLLPKIGIAYISTKFDSCKTPAVLKLGVISDGRRSMSTFYSRDHEWEYRRSGSPYWPLQLQVMFRESTDKGYYVDACLHTNKTGDTTCFMSEFIERKNECRMGNKADDDNNVFSTTMLYPILALCLLLVFIIGIAMFYRYYVSHNKSKDKRPKSYDIRKVPKYYIHKASDSVPPLSLLKESVYSHGILGNGYINYMGDNDDFDGCIDVEGDNPEGSKLPNEYDHKYFFGQDFVENDKNGCPGYWNS